MAAFYNNRGDGHSVGDFPLVSVLIGLAVVLLRLSPLAEMWTPKQRDRCSCCSRPAPGENPDVTQAEAPATEAKNPADKPVKPHNL